MYPALTVLKALGKEADPVLWVGSEGGMEADLVQRAGIPFMAIPAAGVHGVGLRALPGNLLRLGRGYWAARKALAEFQPQALFFTGGYVAMPVGLAGRKIPTVLYVPDIEPGLALRTLARFADRITVTAEASKDFFPGHPGVVVTGYPTRPTLTRWDRAEAYQAFDLSPELPILFVFGGSKGAQSINRALIAVLPELLAEMQVVHVSGRLTWPEVEAAAGELTSAQKARYRAYPYLHEEMGAAFTLADLCVCRAGASILGESPLFGLPTALVPYPHAWRYQRVNAQYLVEHGAAVTIEDADLPEKLLPLALGLMGDRERLAQMKAAMLDLARPQAAEAIAEQLRIVAQAQQVRM